MTAIKVFRATPVEDENGDTQPGDFELWKTFEGRAGWGNPDEAVEPGKNTVITSRTVLFRGAEPSGILPTDQVEIDGIRYNIDGAVGEWGDPHTGTQFAVKAVAKGGT